MARLTTLAGVLALALGRVSAASEDYTAACKQIEGVISGASDVVYPSMSSVSLLSLPISPQLGPIH